MNKFILWAGIAAALSARPAAAQSVNINEPHVLAVGTGEVVRTPDYLRLGFTARGEGSTAVAALRALGTQRAAMESSVRALPGIRAIELHDTRIVTQEVRARGCDTDDAYRPRLSVNECAVVGMIATMEVEAKISPASKAGDVASIITQVGGQRVDLRGSGLDDEDAAQASAAAKAVADARRQAEALARAAGGRLGRVLRMQNGDLPERPGPGTVVVTGSRAPVQVVATQLAAPLAFTPQPITRTARVSVVFALEPGTAPAR